jgi:hypothetical protein
MALKHWQSESTDTSKGEEAVVGLAQDKSDSSADVGANGDTPGNDSLKGDEAKASDVAGENATTDSLRTQSIDSSDKLENAPAPTESTAGKQFSSMSQLRLKMGFAKVAENSVSETKQYENQGDSEGTKNPFGFLRKQPLSQSNQEADDKTGLDMATPSNDTAAEGASQLKNAFGFLKKQVTPTDDTVVTDSTAAEVKNPFGFLKKPAVPDSQSVNESTQVDARAGGSATEGVKMKFSSLTMSFGTSLLHKKETQEEIKGQGEAKSDQPDQDTMPTPPPSSPVKATFDNFSKSFEAVKSGANKLLTEISEHDDPFNPKNTRPVITRFSKPAPSSQKPADESLLFMEDNNHDDGLEDVIDFATATDFETTDVLSDPFEVAAQSFASPHDDLFSGLNPQPVGDPTQNLFGDLFDETQGAEEKVEG